jgi:fibronectin-binding autotransporter adhesin
MCGSKLQNARLAAAVAAVALAGMAGHANAEVWQPTDTGTTYDWNNSANWDAAFPNAAGAVADVNNNIIGNQTIRLQQQITLGTLNLGDSDGTNTFTLSTGTAGSLVFESSPAGGETALNVSGTGTVANVISAPTTLGNTSNLTLNFTGTQNLTLSGTLDIAGKQMTITGTGGSLNIGSNASNGGLLGTGTVVKNNTGTINFNSQNTTYTGSIVVNRGSVAVVNGQLHTATITLNGYQTPSGTTAVQNGGSLNIGSGSTFGTPPDNRLPANIILNGGHLGAGGQPLTNPDDTVTDNVDSLKFNSGYSMISIGSGGDDNHVVNVTSITRSAGATTGTRSGSAGIKTKLLTDDGMAGFLIGGGTGPGTTTMSIIPWIVSANTNGNAGNPADWGTYVAGEGIRALNANEYANPASTAELLALSDHANVRGNLGLGNGVSKTINSLIRTSSGTVNIGNGSTLTIASGGLFFGTNTGSMGAAGSPDAGTLNFGSAEAVIYSTSANTNSIGSVITGTGGLTKSGMGTVVLLGANAFSGDTHVSSGTLRVNNGSVLGDGNAYVHAGATLDLLSSDAIGDDDSLAILIAGIHTGKVNLGDGVTDTIGALYFGDELQAFGTWGSSASGAQFTNDTFFSGTGILNVVPEPASLSVLGLAGGMLLMRRRRIG